MISTSVGKYKYQVGKNSSCSLYHHTLDYLAALRWKGIALSSHFWWGLTGVSFSLCMEQNWNTNLLGLQCECYLLCQDTSLQFWYLTRCEAILVIECEDSPAVSLLFSSFTLRECLILCSSLPEGGSSSGLKTSSHTGGSGVEKRSYTHGSSYVTSSKEWRHCTVSKQTARQHKWSEERFRAGKAFQRQGKQGLWK